MLAGRQVTTRTATIAGGAFVKKNASAVGGALSQQQTRTFYSIYEKYAEAYKRYGLYGSLWKLYNPGDIKFGKYVGSDEFGNKYYEDPTDVSGQQRWTEFKENWDEFEGTLIPPKWHLWMHYLTDAKPDEPGQNPENWPKVSISEVSHAPYTNHVAPNVPYYPNMSLYRSRGYGVGSLATKPDEPDAYYIQRNHIRRNRKRSPDFFDDIDYNNPDFDAKKSSEMLRPLDKN